MRRSPHIHVLDHNELRDKMYIEIQSWALEMALVNSLQKRVLGRSPRRRGCGTTKCATGGRLSPYIMEKII